MAIKQISVFLENKPGKLEGMTQVLADAGIDLRALSLAETKDFGIVRMIVDDVYETATILKDNDYIASMTPVTREPARSPPSAEGPRITPTARGDTTAMMPGIIISFRAACVEMATQDL